MEAIKEYQEAIKRDPTNSAYRNNLAAALQKVGDFPAAKVACEKALELDPTYVKAWAKKGDIEFFMKEYHKALETYKKGLEIEPNNSLCVQVRPWPTHRPHRRLVMPEKLTPLPFLLWGCLSSQGLQKTTARIHEASSQEVDMERAAHGMADPEIQMILSDPIIRQVLTDINENPTAGRKALADPMVAAKINKLIAAGVLRTA